MRNRRLLTLPALLLLLALLLCGCSAEEQLAKELASGASALESESWAAAEKAYAGALALDGANAKAAAGLVAAREALYKADGGEQTRASLIEAYGSLYAAGDFGAPEYLRLAALCGEEGDTVRQRDALERAIRLAPAQETADLLFSLVADAAADEPAVSGRAEALLAALAADDADAAAALLLDNSWMPAMMPKLTSGYRRWRLAGEGGGELLLEVGYDAGVPATRAWYTDGAGAARVLQKRGETLCYAALSLSGDGYTGDFSYSFCDAAAGDVASGSGVLSGNFLTGDYAEKASVGGGAAALAELWSARAEAETDDYSGSFLQGVAQAKQQSAASSKGGIVYAYDADATGYLYLCPEGAPAAADYAFSCESFGIPLWPAW